MTATFLSRLLLFSAVLPAIIADGTFVVPDTDNDEGTLTQYEKSGACYDYLEDGPADKANRPCKVWCKENENSDDYGCMGYGYDRQWYEEHDKSLIREDDDGNEWVLGHCGCDFEIFKSIASVVAEGLGRLDNILCGVALESFGMLLDIGTSFVPGVGQASKAVQMSVRAAKTLEENAGGAGDFSDWIGQTCDIGNWDVDPKAVFNPLKDMPDTYGTSKGCLKKNKKKCKKPDSNGDPKPGSGPGSGPPKTKEPTKTKEPSTLSRTPSPTPGSCKRDKRAQNLSTKRFNVVVSTECNQGLSTTHAYTITTLKYAAGAKPTQVSATCREEWNQACYHYSSAIRNNPQWETLTCPDVAATKVRKRMHTRAPEAWNNQHSEGWRDTNYREIPNCQLDEYPPLYLLDRKDPIYGRSGKDITGQSIRWLPAEQNQGAGRMWRSICFEVPLEGWSPADKYDAARNKNFKPKTKSVNPTSTNYEMGVTVQHRPEFTIAAWNHKPNSQDDGLSENPCWPKKIAPLDPGFTLLTFDNYYKGNKPPYDYVADYKPGKNGKRDLGLDDVAELEIGLNNTAFSD